MSSGARPEPGWGRDPCQLHHWDGKVGRDPFHEEPDLNLYSLVLNLAAAVPSGQVEPLQEAAPSSGPALHSRVHCSISHGHILFLQ